jgi:hypothetical protein
MPGPESVVQAKSSSESSSESVALRGNFALRRARRGEFRGGMLRFVSHPGGGGSCPGHGGVTIMISES